MKRCYCKRWVGAYRGVLLPVVVAAALQGCGGGDDSENSGETTTPEPEGITLNSIEATDQIKSFAFTWSHESVSGVVFQVCRYDPNAENDCHVLGESESSPLNVEVPSLLHRDRYFIREKKEGGEKSSNVEPDSHQLIAAAGLLKDGGPGFTIGSFGFSVDFAVLEDGTEIMAVGAPYSDSDETVTPSDGVVYLYEKNGSKWDFLQQIRPVEYFVGGPEKLQFLGEKYVSPMDYFVGDSKEDASHGERFGISLDLTRDGKTLVIGAPSDFGTDPAVYVFRKKKNDKRWVQELRYGNTIRDYENGNPIPRGYTDGEVQAHSLFGWNVSVSDDGNTIAAGAVQWNSKGAVWILQRVGKNQKYQRVAHLNGAESKWFGLQVILSADGGSLIVSDSRYGGNHKGAVFFYDSKHDWRNTFGDADDAAEEPDGSLISNKDGEEFGWTLGLSENSETLVVSARFNNEDMAGVNGANTGCGTEPDACSESGAVYVYHKEGNDWKQQAQIKAEKVFPWTEFGEGVAISPDGDRLYVGVRGDDNDKTGVGGEELLANHPKHVEKEDTKDYGSLYTYVRKEGNWAFDRYVQVPVGYSSSKFGKATVAVSPSGTVAVPLLDDSDETKPRALGAGIGDNRGAHDSGSVVLF